MNGISHKQAIKWIDRRMDGLLNDRQLSELDEHLQSCDSCRAYADNMDGLSAHLQNEFHRHWDTQMGPSQNVLDKVTTHANKLPLRKRIAAGARLFAGAMALIVLTFVINFVISQLESTSQVTNAIETVNDPSRAEDRLLAIASDQTGNFDVYTIRANGTGLTNLTNDPAKDTNPIWSPDGKHIAFESDRNGFTQIYVMDPNGSNVIQITKDEADHKLPLNYNSTHNPWSPDSRRLIFIQEEFNGEMEALYSIDINGGNKITLANGRIDGKFSLRAVSWAPNGMYIGYVLNVSSTPKDTFVPTIYVVEPDGSNIRELKSFLPAGKQFDLIYTYYWSSNGQSIVFPALTSDPLREIVYELDLHTNTFINETETKPLIADWREEITLITDLNQEGTPLVWERSDGTNNTFEASKGWGEACSLDFTRSPQNNFAFGVYCPYNKFNMYWTNTDGSTIRQLLTLPMDVNTGGVGDIAWSPDDRYIAFAITSKNTSLYILNVEQSLANPSTPPIQVPISKTELYSIPSWQPVVNNEVIQEQPTPAAEIVENTFLPTKRLLAFTSDQNGNFDIYTIRADGSGLTNLTNNPAQDVSPAWSPDGKRIAFESDRNGFRQIFVMDADGSNLVQLNENEEEADQWIGEPYNLSLNLWSPDGNKLIFYEVAPGDEKGMLYLIDANGENKKPLVNETGKYYSPSWSPDGKHIAFIAIENSVPRIYITDANGDNLTNVTEALPSNETLYPMKYSWSRNGQFIAFIASNWNYLLGRGNEGTSTYKWTAYEASLDGNTLVANASADSQMGGYWDGTYFLSGSAAVASSPEFKWVHSDGTSTTANPIENCQKLLDSNTGNYITGYSSYKQSSNGNVVIGAYCPNGDKWLFWANSEGIFIPLLNSPIHVQSIPSNAMHLWAPPDFIWSSDDKYIAFNIFSSGKTDMYIVNVNDALQNPSIQPFQLAIGLNYSLYYSPVWQPTP